MMYLPGKRRPATDAAEDGDVRRAKEKSLARSQARILVEQSAGFSEGRDLQLDQAAIWNRL